MSGLQERAREAAEQIAEILNDRRGLHIDDLDDDIQEEILGEFASVFRAEVVRVLEDVIAEHAAQEELSCGRGYIGAVEVKHLRALASEYREGGAAPEEKTT